MQKETSAEMKFFIWNDKIYNTSKFPNNELHQEPSVYEVIRILAGVPLFLEEHLNRLRRSVELLNYPYTFTDSQIKEQIYKLIEVNQHPPSNIKIVVNHLNSVGPNIFIFFVLSHYPTLDNYTDGVSAITYRAERRNPNAKVVANHLRDEINKAIKAQDAYEAILLNDREEITEGSRSNIFLVKNSSIYTAPERDVLVGITRSRVISICKELQFSIIEEPIPVAFLNEIDGLFLTGTSPKVLPISSVNNNTFNSSNNKIIKKIIEAYDQAITNYIASYL